MKLLWIIAHEAITNGNVKMEGVGLKWIPQFHDQHVVLSVDIANYPLKRKL